MTKHMELELLRCIPTEDGKLECSYIWRTQESDAQQLLDDCSEEDN